MRLHAQTATIENGFVHLPEEAHWLADYLHELTMFPAGRYDDQVDSTAQALAWTKIRPPGWGIFEYMRREAERLRSPQPEPTVRLLAPVGASHLQGCPVVDMLFATDRRGRERGRAATAARGLSEGRLKDWNQAFRGRSEFVAKSYPAICNARFACAP